MADHSLGSVDKKTPKGGNADPGSSQNKGSGGSRVTGGKNKGSGGSRVTGKTHTA